MLNQCGAVIPARGGGFAGNIVAGQPRNGNWRKVLNADFGGKCFVVGHYLVEHSLVVIHQIHFVHCQYDMFYAQQMHQIAVTTGLRQNTLARIDQNNGEVCRRCAGDHIAGILLMPGRVGDNEFAFFGGKKPLSDIDCDALFAFGG